MSNDRQDSKTYKIHGQLYEGKQIDGGVIIIKQISTTNPEDEFVHAIGVKLELPEYYIDDDQVANPDPDIATSN